MISAKDYYTLAKPERTMTNVLTALAGYLFASRWHIDWPVFLALIAGTTLIIASACVLNNYIDRDLDEKMERTRSRALVVGKIPIVNALIYAAVLGALGFWLLAYTNWLTFAVGVVAYVSYVAIYDFAKRKSVHGTLVGTVPGGASLVAGYTAVNNRLDATALLLFLTMAAWQMAHFYAIAIYRLEDYKKAGVPVWPARYSVANTKQWILAYVAGFALFSVLIYAFGGTGLAYLAVAIWLGAFWLARGVLGLKDKLDDAKWARSMFSTSLGILVIFVLALALAPLLP